VGGASVDHVVRAPVGAAFDQPGGPGLFASLGARLALGATDEVRLGGPLPEDAPQIRDALARAAVEIRWAPRVASAPRLWILDSREGRRVLRTAPATHELADDDPEPEAPAPEPEAGFGTGLDALLLSAPAALPRSPLDARTIVAVDPDQDAISREGWGYLDRLAERAGLVLPSRVQLRQLAALEPGGPGPEEVAELVRARTGMSVVARLDAEGALVLDAGGGATHVPAEPVDVIDTTGAGDSHAGALVAALASGLDLVAATRTAARVAARTLAGWGPEGLLRALSTPARNDEEIP